MSRKAERSESSLSEAHLGSDAWGDYVWWQSEDRRIVKRLNTLIKDVERNQNTGIGRPESLKYGFGYWTRRITDEHRLVYKVSGDKIPIAACRYHYGR